MSDINRGMGISVIEGLSLVLEWPVRLARRGLDLKTAEKPRQQPPMRIAQQTLQTAPSGVQLCVLCEADKQTFE